MYFYIVHEYRTLKERLMEYHQIVRKSLSIIEEEISDPPSLDILAFRFNMSKFYFHRIFSALTGSSYKQYTLTRRVNRAIHLINTTDLSLTDIAYRLNFSDQASFTRTFKRLTGSGPGQLRKKEVSLQEISIPEIYSRTFKNLNGDLIKDFSLEPFTPRTLHGVAFEIDFADPDFKDQIHSYAREVNQAASKNDATESYMIYSNCQPGSSKFKALYGVTQPLLKKLSNSFTVEIPEIFCSKFKYTGDLLDIADIFTMDFARFLKISRLDQEESHIELVQVFTPEDTNMTNYDIYVPIKKLENEIEIS